MKTKQVKGWAVTEWIELEGCDPNANLFGVCSCKWRKEKCVGRKECSLFGGETKSVQIATLRDKMGKKFPKLWESERLLLIDPNQDQLRSDALTKLGKEFFKKCIPVCVEVRKR